MSSSQLALESVLVKSLEVRVATNVLLSDEDVGDTALVGHLLESILDGRAVLWKQRVSILG